MINTNAIQKDEAVPAIVPEMKKVDLACGDSKPEGFVGVDVCKTPSVDIVHDLTVTPWPFEDSSIDEARCSHFFEHLEPQQRIDFMNELHRVLKLGAGCVFITPKGFDRQVQDFSHKWPPIVPASYYYFSKDWYRNNKLDHYIELHGIKCDFEPRPMQITTLPEFATKSEEHKLFAVNYYTNAALDLIMLMVKK